MSEPNDRDRALPLRTLAAALVLGAAGWALARAVAVMLASIAVPSVSHTVLPAKFAYGAPAGWSESTAWPWALAVACVLLFPLLFNPTWLSRRLASPLGAAKLVAAAVLLVLVATAALIGADLF